MATNEATAGQTSAGSAEGGTTTTSPPSPTSEVVGILKHFMDKCNGSRRLILLVVAIGLLLDNMLLTSVVPIIPAYLYNIHHEKALVVLNETYRTSTLSPTEQWNARRAELDAESNKLFAEKLEEISRKVPLSADCEKTISEYVNKEGWPTTTTMATTTEGATTTEMSDAERLRHEELVSENTEVGVIFASKPVVQVITNPFVGVITNKIGYSWPLFGGLIMLFISTMIFALGSTYPTLFLARSLQGVGSAFTSVAGMGMLADQFPDDRERGNSMAFALGGLALGVLIGPPFGGVMYEFIGKSSPFIVLAMLALADGCLQLMVLQPKVMKEEQEGASLMTLIRDPYIVMAAGAITFANLGIAILEPSLPLWMMDTMDSTNVEQGAAFLPASISYLIGTNIFGPLGHRMGRWLSSMLGLLIIGISLLLIPMATSLSELIVPNAAIGFAIGMVDSSIMPMLGFLVDIRHTSIYGNVYAIGDAAFCLGFAIGPALSSTLVTWLGFSGLCVVTALVCFAFAPCMLLLRNPPAKNEIRTLLKDGSVKYASYLSEGTDDDDNTTATTNNNDKKMKSFEMVP